MDRGIPTETVLREMREGTALELHREFGMPLSDIAGGRNLTQIKKLVNVGLFRPDVVLFLREVGKQRFLAGDRLA